MKCCNPNDAKSVAGLAVRIGFGVSLLLVGLVHYMTLDPFIAMTSDGLGALSGLGTLWAYVLPALQIVGGALIALGMYTHIGAWCAGIALGSIPVGLLLKPVLSGVGLDVVMPMATNTFLWLILFYLAVKSCCCGSCGTNSGGGQ